MASTTFVNYQTVIDAGWLNDVNSAVYSGTFQATTLSPTNITVSGAITANGTISGSGFSTYLASPPAIGGTTAAAGSFTTLSGSTSVTSPIVGAASGASLSLRANGTTYATILGAGTNNGYFGIGTTSPSFPLTVSSSATTYIGINGANTYSAGLQFQNAGTTYCYVGRGLATGNNDLDLYTNTATNIKFFTNSAEAGRFDSSGNLLVGQTTVGTSNSNSLSLQNGAVGVNHVSGSSSGSNYVYFAYNASLIGSITQSGTSGVLYNITSDRRLKANIVDFTDSGKYIDSFKPRSFTWIADNSQDIGFITDEYQQTLPSAISGEANATKEEEYEITPAVKDEQGNITTPAVMGTRTVAVYQQGDFSTSAKMAIIIAELQSLRARLKAANIA